MKRIIFMLALGLALTCSGCGNTSTQGEAPVPPPSTQAATSQDVYEIHYVWVVDLKPVPEGVTLYGGCTYLVGVWDGGYYKAIYAINLNGSMIDINQPMAIRVDMTTGTARMVYGANADVYEGLLLQLI